MVDSVDSMTEYLAPMLYEYVIWRMFPIPQTVSQHIYAKFFENLASLRAVRSEKVWIDDKAKPCDQWVAVKREIVE